MKRSMKSISTHLMFQGGNAQTALDLYASVFPQFTVVSMEKYGAEDSTPDFIKIAKIDFYRHRLIVIDSPVPHKFDFTPSMSLFVDFDRAADLDRAFERLADGGDVKMPLNDYGFSSRFGWTTDRFGVSWQLNLPRVQ
jgi:predicted 3-demethylubiquinone-9 3-methyltransferase (glyoxalase superfamily)